MLTDKLSVPPQFLAPVLWAGVAGRVKPCDTRPSFELSERLGVLFALLGVSELPSF